MRITKKSRILFEKHKTHFAIAYRNFQDAENYGLGMPMPIPRTGWEMHHNTQRYFLTQNAAIVAVVFSAFTLEALINAYAVRYLPEDSFEKLERKSPVDKWKIIPQSITKKVIPTDGQAYQNLKWLFKTRDALAHSKTKIVTLGELFEEDFQSESLSTVKDARRAIDTVRELVGELKKLDPRVDVDWLSDVQEGKDF